MSNTTTMVQTSETDIDFSVARPGTNVILVAEGKEIHVNKEFLSMFSPYFNTLLMSPNFAESSSSRITIDHDYNQLLQCIQIVHQNGIRVTGHMPLSEVEDLLKSADRFDLPVVRRFCESELMCMSGCSTSAHRFLLACRFNLLSVKAELLKNTAGYAWRQWRDSKTVKNPEFGGPRHVPNWQPGDDKDSLVLSQDDLLTILSSFKFSN